MPRSSSRLAILVLGGLDGEPVEELGVDHGAVADVGLVGDAEGRGVGARRQHHGHHRTPVLAGEIEVALVVARTAEDGARAVAHDDEVGDIDRQLDVWLERVDRDDAGVEALLLGLGQRFLAGADLAALLDEGCQLLALLGEVSCQRVLGRDRHERGAEDGVVARGEDLERGELLRQLAAFEREPHVGAGRLADPVALLRADEIGPRGLQAIQRLQQLLGVGGDPEEPLRQVALLDHGAGAPAAAVDHLLVGEHGVLHRIPVDLGGLAVGQLLLQEVQEQPLLVHVVVGIAGGELALPVDRQPHGLELGAHGVDVLVGPFARVDLALHGRVLGRQAEGVPAHGMEHVEPLGAHVAGHHVAQRVVAHVPHVNAPRRIGEHLELIALGLLALVLGAEGVALLPHLLPVLLAHGRVVAFACHEAQVSWG